MKPDVVDVAARTYRRIEAVYAVHPVVVHVDHDQPRAAGNLLAADLRRPRVDDPQSAVRAGP
ncbi:hypothetical protein [Micromonospora sp. WMMD710]|uniref:hypothetical protein n=1 Tax=Micromonospora sp. WMMD710 TaxID=3016085 RepID=UPI002416E81B|nr:hypothetical protein [Micromonospora sp. WMMD710]MDG4758436.1 hypothetical protein [Micromonospora sp. WMMD710]